MVLFVSDLLAAITRRRCLRGPAANPTSPPSTRRTRRRKSLPATVRSLVKRPAIPVTRAPRPAGRRSGKSRRRRSGSAALRRPGIPDRLRIRRMRIWPERKLVARQPRCRPGPGVIWRWTGGRCPNPPPGMRETVRSPVGEFWFFGDIFFFSFFLNDKFLPINETSFETSN